MPTPEKPAVKDRVTLLAKEVLGLQLKGRGFRRNGRIFWRNSSEVCQVITLRMTPWGTRDDSEFDVFLGAYWHEVEKLLGNSSSERMPPLESQCTFRIDLGWTTPARLQKSWALNLKTDLVELGEQVLNDLVDFGLPWLDYRSDLKYALESTRYLTEDKEFGPGCYVTHELISDDARLVFMVKRGELASVRKELKDRIANGFPKSEVNAFAKRIGIRL